MFRHFLFLALLLPGSALLCAQDQPPVPQPALPPPSQALTPDQLNDLFAPIALYPDPLVTQIMVACTYPLEVVEAYQWLQRNPGLSGPNLTAAAQQQNWDASVQALVMFPDVLKLLNDDITWTTNLGNAFLAQQPDVMAAIQSMRQSAQQNGKLEPTREENVVDTTDNGQPVIEIVPTDPDVIYVPVYSPVWVWGPARWYPYPRWFWPPAPGFGFGAGINVGVFFGLGWHGWGGWGWAPGWANHTVIVNNAFIHQYNFNASHLESVHGFTTWQHDAAHRGGVPYASATLNDRYRGNVLQAVAPRATPEGDRTGQTERMGNREVPRNAPAQQEKRGMFSGIEHGAAAATHAEHGFSSMGAARSAPAPRGGGGGGGKRR